MCREVTDATRQVNPIEFARVAVSPGLGRVRPVHSAETAYYFERFGYCPRQIEHPPHPELGMVVVIPCCDEPALLNTLESLRRCYGPQGAVEVIVVINSSEDAALDKREQNKRTEAECRQWIEAYSNAQLRFHALHFSHLPKKRAGVGLARKIGMDEALARLDAVGRITAPIVCFDADCECDPNYLVALEEYFIMWQKTPGCSVYFEHPLGGPFPEAIYAGITLYELHLRYYVQALRWTGYPHAFHTIGSSMAVRGDVYRKQGGMNKRQAGEDFYFLHKVIPLGGFGDLVTTRVLASPRPSERVPFGTGRAVREFMTNGAQATYPWQAFVELQQLLSRVQEMYLDPRSWPSEAGPALASFLQKQEFGKALLELRENSSSFERFQKRFYWWLDGFRVMKYIHHARDHFYGAGSLPAEALKLWRCLTDDPKELTGGELLLALREWERSHPWLPGMCGKVN